MPSWRRVSRLPQRLSRFPQRVPARAPVLARLRRPALVVNAALVVLLLVGAFFSYRTIAVADTTTASTGTGRAVPVTLGTVTSSVSASGTVQSASTANANFVTSGTVTEIDVKVGDAVTAGQGLAQNSPPPAPEQLTAPPAHLTPAHPSPRRRPSPPSIAAATLA